MKITEENLERHSCDVLLSRVFDQWMTLKTMLLKIAHQKQYKNMFLRKVCLVVTIHEDKTLNNLTQVCFALSWQLV